jgi:integrase
MPTWSTGLKPGHKRQEARPLSIDEQKGIIALIKDEPIPRNIAIYLALTTGVSSGELCALRWQDIDVKAKMLHVRGIILSYYAIDQDTKSKRWVASKESPTEARDIPLAPSQVTFLKKEVKKHLPENYIFSNSSSPAEPRMVRKYVTGFLKRLGIKDRQYKDLHNTFAIQCIQTGCDIFTLAALLGSSSIPYCAAQYGSYFKKAPRPAIERLMVSLGE